MQGARSEADRQLPIGDEIFLDHLGHFVRDPDAASKALIRAGFAPTPQSIQVNPDPAGGAPSRPAPATSPPCSLAATSRCCSRPPTPCSAASSMSALRAMAACTSRRLRSPMPPIAHAAARRPGLSRAAARANAAPGRYRRRARNGGLHARARRARRDAGGPHPDIHPPDRADGLAAALARPSERRARLDQRRDRCRRRMGSRTALRALHRPPGDARDVWADDRARPRHHRARRTQFVRANFAGNSDPVPAVHRRLRDQGRGR